MVNHSYSEKTGQIDTHVLKRFARLAGGSQNMARASLVGAMEAALNDPAKLRTALRSLPANQQEIMGMLKLLGGEATEGALCAGFYAAGNSLSGPGTLRDAFHDLLNKLVQTGLALNQSQGYTFTRLNPVYRSAYMQDNLIFSDERIMAMTRPPKEARAQLLPLNNDEAGERVMVRAPRLLLMELITLVQGIEHLGGLKLTQAGLVRATELKKLSAQLNWEGGNLVDGPLSFHGALVAMIEALRAAGALEKMERLNSMQLTPFASKFLHLPTEEQVSLLAFAMPRIAAWREDMAEMHARFDGSQYPDARAALLFCLRSLPDEAGFFHIDEFAHLFYRRVGDVLRLRREANYYAAFAYQQTHMKDRMRDWLKIERPWLDKALASWLYFFGLVELGLSSGMITSFRLTELGKAALFPERERPLVNAAPREEGPVWIVQPNFDVVVYLNRMTSVQLAFIEKHTERQNVQEHMAQYKLTRDSVYRGLESGTKADELIEALQAGAGRELPQNVSAEIRGWAAQRERVVLWRRGALAEFPDGDARELAMRAGLAGKPVGERFLLMDAAPGKPLSRVFKQTVNYDQTPHRSLLVDEQGIVSYHRPTPDLLLDARLSAWTEPYLDGQRRFTRASVQSAVNAGRSLSSLLKLLDERQYQIIPMMTRLMLRAWAGEAFNVGLGRLFVLRVPYGELNYAIQQSELLRPFVLSTVTPGIYLVKADKEDELRAALKTLGINVSEALVANELPSV